MKSLLACLLLPALAHAQLNDTGQTACTDSAGAAIACAALGDHPGQDGRYGRDAQAGAAAFDLFAISGGDCVVDRVTGLTWSGETLTGPWASFSGIAYDRCGIASGWRLPTRRELLSTVHHGTSHPASALPAAQSAPYWSSDAQGGSAWAVDFTDGDTRLLPQADSHAARLVVRPVNQPPTITPGANIVLKPTDRPGPITLPGWATGIGPGSAREAGQHLTATVELLPSQPGDPQALAFDEPPSLDPATGDLRFTIGHQFFTSELGYPIDPVIWQTSAGLARARITLRDDGGTAGGGQDSTTTAEFTIFLDPAPQAGKVSVQHSWKSDCIPLTLRGWDADTDPRLRSIDPMSQAHWPTIRITEMPGEGLLWFGTDEPLPNPVPMTRHALGWSTDPATIDPATPNSASGRFNMTLCYEPLSSTYVGSDTFLYTVVDSDGNESAPASVDIHIFNVGP
ncbi:DUF1566 domain-containing protein [Ottowia sp.]|uniref:Lcl C-terminal domain-containing protein n=1 Tax=Ottowia sp. TaxID=1898956 RepID=UPI0039E3A323